MWTAVIQRNCCILKIQKFSFHQKKYKIMARQIVVLFLVFFAVLGLASAAVDRHAASAPAEEPLDNGTDSNVIGTTGGAYNIDEAAPVGGPVPAGAFPNASPAESPKSGATTAEVTSVVGVVAAAVTGSFFF